ncbi:MAG: ABC transporter ATP-binding protein [Trueperaceae bacterium]|nr:MAG: ABC transporter ATP-binding protein [Trueperaceae bacterium]
MKIDDIPLRATGLSKSYPFGEVTVQALANVDLEVQRGEFLAVMGPSGSGKSTLLHLLGLLDAPDHGEVVLDGQQTHQLDDDTLTILRREKLGFVFQSFELIPNLSAAENILLPAEINKQRSEGEKRLGNLARRLGIHERLGHRPRQLSGGERQRVALARALINRPAVILADEPTGNLDSRSGALVLEILQRGVREEQWTVIMVTHDPHAALCADRIVFLRDGTICGQSRTSDPGIRTTIERFAGL